MSENTTSATQAHVVDDDIDQILASLQEALRTDREYHLEEGLDFDDWDRHNLDDDVPDDSHDVMDSFHMYQPDDCDDFDDIYFEQMLLESTDTKACVGSRRRVRLGTPRTKVKCVHD